MLSNVSAPALLRLSAYATPTAENNLSTEADDAGQPKYWRAIHIGLSPYNKSPGFRYRRETTLFESVDGPIRCCGRVGGTPHVGDMCG